jgi:uncharacterized protein
VVRTDALTALDLQETGYGWTVELVGRALAHPALRVVEVPVGFMPRVGGRSKVAGRLGPSLRAGLAMLTRAVSATRRRGLLVMMAKAPHSDRSKTRLAAEIGARAATGFWVACLKDAARKVNAAGREAGLDVLAVTPSQEDAEAIRQLTGLPALAQRRPGLGEALLEASELRARFTIAVSADTPTLPVERLLEAVHSLGSAAAVLGPCDDGGYYLVGLRRGVSVRRRRKAFLGTPMGKEDVFQHTKAALGGAFELESWPDVDTAAELDRLAVQLEVAPLAAPAVAGWLFERQAEKEAG